MRKRLKKKLGLLLPLRIDSVLRDHDKRVGRALYDALTRLMALGSMHGYAAMETTPNGDGTFTHRITAPRRSGMTS